MAALGISYGLPLFKGATFAFVKEERVILISYLWSTRLSYAFLDFFITYNFNFFFLVGVDGQI